MFRRLFRRHRFRRAEALIRRLFGREDHLAPEDRLVRLVLANGHGKLLKLQYTGRYAQSILSICDEDERVLASMLIDEEFEFELWEHIGNAFVFECVELDQYKPV